MNEGQVGTTTGRTIAAADFERDFEEFQVAHSTALQSRRMGTRKCYFVGPLARINLSRDQLSDSARRLADEVELASPCLNPHKSIIARGLELVHAYETALDILRDYRPCRVPRVAYAYRDAEGCAATEAPRGLLYHRYAIDAQGHVKLAKIVPPTSQNQAQIEEDVATLLPSLLGQQDEQIALHCETLIRSYDPCISCSTHFLKLHWKRT